MASDDAIRQIVQSLLAPQSQPAAPAAAPATPAPTFLDMLGAAPAAPTAGPGLIDPGVTWGGRDQNTMHPLDAQMYRVYGKPINQEDL